MNWNIKNKDSLAKNGETEFHPIVLKLLRNRGIEKEEDIRNFFSFNYEKDLADPMSINQMEKTVERIIAAKENSEKVAIFGDYDADGVTATVIVWEALRDLGFSDVMYYIPDRQLEGYGINEKAIEYLHDKEIKLIITVDCGITSAKEIEKAKQLGIDVIVTDHHHVPNVLPEAHSIINPHLEDSGFAFRDLAGVGVAFKLIQAIYKKIDPKRIDHLKWALDLVAIGTIADCVPLLGENRVLVKYGLIVLSKTKRMGFQEMFKVGRIAIDENNVPDAHRVAFQIAPRINAAGRIDHANLSCNLIMEKNIARAREMALDIEAKNQERQKITGEIVREIKILAENMFSERKIIFAANAHWPIGILGLVAGKIADEYEKPTIILNKKNNELTGSLRSIPEIDIMEVLDQCSDLLQKFGGHAQAAGITVSEEKADEFFSRAEKIVEKMMDGKEIISSLDIDTEISADDISWDLMEWLKKMEPFGEGNPEPLFIMRNIKIHELKICGNGDKHLKMSLGATSGSPKIFDSIGFGFGAKFPDLKQGDIIDAAFNLSEDNWNGSKKIQMKLIDLKKI